MHWFPFDYILFIGLDWTDYGNASGGIRNSSFSFCLKNYSLSLICRFGRWNQRTKWLVVRWNQRCNASLFFECHMNFPVVFQIMCKKFLHTPVKVAISAKVKQVRKESNLWIRLPVLNRSAPAAANYLRATIQWRAFSSFTLHFFKHLPD